MRSVAQFFEFLEKRKSDSNKNALRAALLLPAIKSEEEIGPK
jgi:hypothetical protein